MINVLDQKDAGDAPKDNGKTQSHGSKEFKVQNLVEEKDLSDFYTRAVGHRLSKRLDV